MDLFVDAAVKDKITIELKKPGTDKVLTNDDGSPMTVTVYGPYSKTYRKITLENQGKYFSMFRKGKQVDLTPEEMAEMNFELVVKCIADWDITAGGEKPKCTEKNIRNVLDRVPPIKDQIQSAVNDIESFLGNSETT